MRRRLVIGTGRVDGDREEVEGADGERDGDRGRGRPRRVRERGPVRGRLGVRTAGRARFRGHVKCYFGTRRVRNYNVVSSHDRADSRVGSTKNVVRGGVPLLSL